MTRSYDRTVIIGLTGRAGSGKDTAAAYLAARYGFHRAAFADALRETVAAFLRAGGITDMGWMHDPARKNTPIPGIGYSARHLMQTLGTEWARNCLDPWTWVRILEQRLGMTVDAERPVAPRIVVTDVRFPNEARWLGLHCAPIIRLHRNSATGAQPHASEEHIDTLPAHVDLFNHGDLAGLHTLLDGTMADMGITQMPMPQPDLFATAADAAATTGLTD